MGINDVKGSATTVVDGKRVADPYYRAWSGILTRCYSQPSLRERPTYKDCTVCEEWLLFSNFKSWMEKQDWEGKHLDKDLLVEGNKIYSPETCVFVDAAANTLFSYSEVTRGKYPLGVSYHKEKGKFSASCSIDGKRRFIGYHSTPREAEISYLLLKADHVEKTAESQDDERLIKSLLLRVENMRKRAEELSK